MRIITPVLLIVLAASAIGLTQHPEDEIISRLQLALAKESKDREAAHQGTTDYSNIVAQVQMAIDSGRWPDASMALNNILQSNHTPEVINICRELRSQILLEVASREDAVINQIDDAVKKAGQACLDAKDPKDLDQVLHQLSDLRPADQTYRPERVRAAYSKLDVALNFVARWQDYVSKKARSDDKGASDIIQKLIDHNNVYPIVARSELIDRTQPGASPSATPTKISIEELFKNAKSLDDLDQLLLALRQRERNENETDEMRSLVEQVATLRGAYADFGAGRYGPAFDSYVNRWRPNQPGAEYVAPLRQQLLLKVLPYYLNSPDVGVPAPNETMSDFLLRLVKGARQNKNWDLALRALQTLKAVAYANATEPAWLTADIVGYSALLVAEKEERAAQFPEAIASYQKALECNGQNLPVDFITQRLTALRRSRGGRK